MPGSEQGSGDSATATPGAVGEAPVPETDAEVSNRPTGRTTVEESPTGAAARMLELAAVTADRLVADARTEAESLVAEAATRAEALAEASRDEAARAAADLARTRDEQTAELDHERSTALAGLADEKAALEAQIARLRQLDSDYHSQMRRQLTEQLSLLDTIRPEPHTDG